MWQVDVCDHNTDSARFSRFRNGNAHMEVINILHDVFSARTLANRAHTSMQSSPTSATRGDMVNEGRRLRLFGRVQGYTKNLFGVERCSFSAIFDQRWSLLYEGGKRAAHMKSAILNMCAPVSAFQWSTEGQKHKESKMLILAFNAVHFLVVLSYCGSM